VGGGRWCRTPPRWATPAGADNSFSVRLAELTFVHVHVNVRGISDEKGRLMVVMAHNTDLPDTWEREGENQEYFDRFSPNGYAVGANVALYAMTH
jgi:hypothetical protein